MRIDPRYIPALKAVLRSLRHDEEVALQIINDAITTGKNGNGNGIGSYVQTKQVQIEAVEFAIDYFTEQGRIHVSPLSVTISIVAFIVLLAAVIVLMILWGGGG